MTIERSGAHVKRVGGGSRIPEFKGKNAMSYSEARIHFDKAKNRTVDPAIKDIAEGLRHLSHAIEEDIRKVEEDIQAIQNRPR